MEEGREERGREEQLEGTCMNGLLYTPLMSLFHVIKESLMFKYA